MLCAVAFVTWRRAHGEAAPGARVAAGAIAVATALALLRPLPERLPLFPVWAYEEWGLSLAIWSALGAVVGGAARPRAQPAAGRAVRLTYDGCSPPVASVWRFVRVVVASHGFSAVPGWGRKTGKSLEATCRRRRWPGSTR